jgi:F0F1-type ATP synthase assembly protein I
MPIGRRESLRRPRLVGLILGSLLAFVFGGPAGVVVFLAIAVIAAVFTIEK